MVFFYLLSIDFFIFFFFFQAEDGIRDGTVTGVQTCALPISVVITGLVLSAALGERGKAAEHRLSESEERFRLMVLNVTDYAILMLDPQRSEERRVGKECRDWWSRYQYKKKEKYMSRAYRE